MNSSIWSIFGLVKLFFWIAIILVFFFLQTVLKITLEKQLPCISDSWVSTPCRLFHQYCWLWYLVYLELMNKPKIQSLQSWTSLGNCLLRGMETTLCGDFIQVGNSHIWNEWGHFFSTYSAADYYFLLFLVKWYMKCFIYMLKSLLFQASIRNCLNCVHNCNDHSSLDYFFLITSVVFGGKELIFATTFSFLTLLWLQIHTQKVVLTCNFLMKTDIWLNTSMKNKYTAGLGKLFVVWFLILLPGKIL